jgi:hypothetical protein
LPGQGLGAYPPSQHELEDQFLAAGETGRDGIEHPVDFGLAAACLDLVLGVLKVLLGNSPSRLRLLHTFRHWFLAIPPSPGA